MTRVFDGLILSGLGDPLESGSFFFDKGASPQFHYKILSGGEKAAFDLILDMIVKRVAYDDTIYCIDEPETHINTRLQARLLDELVGLLPDGCQLWISTHSIGMMKQARDLKEADPDQVAFLDFSGRDFDAPVVMVPTTVDRAFWGRTLDVALADLADLVAPRQVVLCEGRPGSQGRKGEFDARCYRAIFAADYPDVDFISVGNEDDVRTDKIGLGKAIQTIVRGTTVLRLVDRDDRSAQEVADLQQDGVRVLSRRHLEAYLLDDEILSRFCEQIGQPDATTDVLAIKAQALADSIGRGNPSDDLKSAAGQIYTRVKALLNLTGVGNAADTFLRDTLAPLLTPDTAVYTALRRDVFDQ
jgi:hypothetical protein